MNEQSGLRRPLIALAVGILLLGGLAYFLLNRPALPDVEPNTASAALAADKAVGAAGMNATDREATEAVIRAYILEHPEIIPEAMTIYKDREVAKRLASVGDALYKPFGDNVIGNPSGDITVIEFSDYNCGYCKSSLADVDKLLREDKNIRLVYRELPVLAATSREAALWALAAAKQGKHDQFHKAMFATGRPDLVTMRAAAQKAGVNLDTAEAFLKTNEGDLEVDRNLATMQTLGFNGTPTFVIGNQILEGAVGYNALKAAVAKARKKTQ